MFHSSIQESIIRIDDIIRDIHALNNGNETDKHVSGGTSVSLTVHALRQRAGFSKSVVMNRDKWLSRISLQTTMTALSHGIILWQQQSSQNLNIEKMAILCELLLETTTPFDNATSNSKLLNELLSKLATVDVGCISFQTFRKAIQKACDEYCIATKSIVLKPRTIYHIFHHQKRILENACEIMFHENGDGMQQASSWIVELCSEYGPLYQEVCNHFIGLNSSVLATFVNQVRLSSSDFVTLYPPEEQSFVMLYETMIKVGDIPLDKESFLVPQVIEELLNVSLSHPSSLPKLIYHFPLLSNWLISSCLSNSSAQRLCLQLCNPLFKNDS